MLSELIINNDIMKALKEISAHKNIMQKVRESDFGKEVQVKDKINQLEAIKIEIGETEKSITEKENELEEWLDIDNNLIDCLLLIVIDYVKEKQN